MPCQLFRPCVVLNPNEEEKMFHRLLLLACKAMRARKETKGAYLLYRRVCVCQRRNSIFPFMAFSPIEPLRMASLLKSSAGFILPSKMYATPSQHHFFPCGLSFHKSSWWTVFCQALLTVSDSQPCQSWAGWASLGQAEKAESQILPSRLVTGTVC